MHKASVIKNNKNNTYIYIYIMNNKCMQVLLKYIYVMSNEQQEHEKERVTYVTRFLLCTPVGDMNIMICELFYMHVYCN